MAIQKRPAPQAAARPATRAAAPSAQRGVPARGQAARPNGPAGGQQYASLNPEDYTAGGLLDDVDVIFESCRFVEWDYNGAIDHPILALLVVMNYNDPGTGQPATADQYYSAGELSRFIPSEDGTHAVSVAGAKGLAGGTNAALLLQSVIDQGFPVERYGDGDVSAMDGLSCHINRVAQPKRGGTITGKTQSGYEATVAVVTKIHKMPWEAQTTKGPGRPTAGAKAAPGRTPVGRTPPPAEPAADVQEEAAGVLIQVLENKGGEVKKQGIPPASFKLLAGNPNRSEILNLLADDEFLALEDYGWTFDGTTVTSAQ